MANFTRLSDEDCCKTAELLEANGGNKSLTANQMGISPRGVDRRIEKYHSRNLDFRHPVNVVEGTEIYKESTTYDAQGNIKSTSVKTRTAQDGSMVVPEGHIVKGVSTLLDSQGNVIQEWVKTKIGEFDPLVLAEQLKDAFKDFKGPEFRSMPRFKGEQNLLTLYPLPDMHLGLFAWKEEAEEDWDLKIALERYEMAMEKVHASAPQSRTAIILGGGDLLHADNSENRTLKSGNILDVDTRYSKVFIKGAELLVFQVELAKKKHEFVKVRILPGNHDEHSAIALTWFLHAWYRNDRQVEIDIDPSVFWFYEHGKTMLAATHGHAAKLTDMPQIMAGRQAEMWGRTIHRYAHGFHIHHKTRYAVEAGSVEMETHQAPTPQDHYHFSKGYLSGRSLSSITYDFHEGETMRTKVVL